MSQTREQRLSWYAANREKEQERGRRNYAVHRVKILKRANKRRALLARWKLAAGCIDCGYTQSSAALDFDHVSGEKKFGIGHGMHRSWKAVAAELEKCVVRCANCHRVRTYC